MSGTRTAVGAATPAKNEGPRCRGCGRRIIWGTTAEGKKIPLDPSAPVYTLLEGNGSEAKVVRDHMAAVSHFATCPKASQFSGAGRTRTTGTSATASGIVVAPPRPA